MSEPYASYLKLPEFRLWEKLQHKRALTSFDIEITARCNHNCRHCYINRPANDPGALAEELSLPEIKAIADEAVSLGALWCLLTGGEPLLRKDFSDLYLYLKKRGLLVSIFTNATLIRREHVRLFKKYPPRTIEVSVYGVTPETYERVSRKSGSFAAFRRGLNLLLEAGLKVSLKTVALRSNLSELPDIASFCRKNGSNDYRFDPFLHLRYDRDPVRNEEIKNERLTPVEIAGLERSDPDRLRALKKSCVDPIAPSFSNTAGHQLIQCGAGVDSFTLSPEGKFRLCASFCEPGCVYNLRSGSLREAWFDFVPRIRKTRSTNRAFLTNCRTCSLINICLWCPAHAYLETGKPDQPADYFCRVAHARAAALEHAVL